MAHPWCAASSRSLAGSGSQSPARANRSAPDEIQRRAPLLCITLEEIACVALLAFFSMQGSIPGIAPTAALEVTGSAPSGLTTIGGIVSQAIANLVVILLVLRHPRLVLRRIAWVPWAAALALFAVASSIWSLDPMLTVRRSLPFVLAGLFGIWFGSRFSLPRQLAILRTALFATAFASVALVLILPAVGLDHTAGHAADWQGVFTQKNACGRIMVLASATVLFAGGPDRRRLALLSLFLFVLAMSGSRGAWVIEAAVLLLWMVLNLAHRLDVRGRVILAAAAPMLLATGACVTALFFVPLMQLLGRDPTLSGRTAIWDQVLEAIGRRAWTGYGYDAFWRGMSGPSLQIDSSVHFVVLHAHNGFLEICLELGAAGLLLFVLSWVRAWRSLWPLWREGAIDRIAWPMALLLLIILYDLDENTLLIYNGLFWILYAAALVTVEEARRDSRHKHFAVPHAMLKLRRHAAARPVAGDALCTQPDQ